MNTAATIERVERDAWESLCRAAPGAIARDLGLEVVRFGNALMTLCARIDQGQFNRLFGFGLGDSGETDALGEAVARFKRAGVRNAFIQIPPGRPDLEAAARRAGLAPYKRPWVKFRRGPADPPRPVTGIRVVQAEGERAELAGETIAAGFGMPPVMAAWLSALVGRPNWRGYLAMDGDAAVGGAFLYAAEGAAWLGAGATRPEARRRGAQSALLARRIADAGEAGAALIATETGKPLEGESHPSYANILRSGFTLAYERANWTFPFD